MFKKLHSVFLLVNIFLFLSCSGYAMLRNETIEALRDSFSNRGLNLPKEVAAMIVDRADYFFDTKTTVHGLGYNRTHGVCATESGKKVFVATGRGISTSINSGKDFVNQRFDGSSVNGVWIFGKKVYLATHGIRISNDEGETYTIHKTAEDQNGLASNIVYGIWASNDGMKIYVATLNGLSISTDGGNTFVTRLPGRIVSSVYVYNDIIYAGTFGGLAISTDGGNTFVTKTTNNGLVCNVVKDVYINNGTLYIGTVDGLSISTDGGNTFVNKTIAQGLVNNHVYRVYVFKGTVYIATHGGISISMDSCQSFINITKTNAVGLGDNVVEGIWVSDKQIYTATIDGLSSHTIPMGG